MKNMSLPIKFSLSENAHSNLQKCELWIMRDGLNSNGSSFDDEGMDRAKTSLKNIPILAYIKKKEDGESDFDEHNMDYVFERDDEGNLCIKEYYLEVPIGVIPETNNYRLEKLNGHNWVVVNGYIWKSYSNEGFEILQRDEEKSVSMEISVGRGEFVNNVYHIKDYEYQGVTILGSDVMPGISGAKIKMEFSKQDNTEFFNKVKELNQMLKEELESEVEELGNNTLEFEETKKKIVDDEDTIIQAEPTPPKEKITEEHPEVQAKTLEEPIEEPVEEEKVEEVVEVEEEKEEPTEVIEEPVEESVEEPTEEDAVEDNVEDFSANISNVVGFINEALTNVTFEEDCFGEIFTSQKYFFEDLLMDTGVAVLYDVETFKYVGVNYSLEGDNVSLDFNSTKEYIPTWKEREVGQNSGFGIVSAFKKDFENKADTIIAKIKNENEELKSFKDQIEKSQLKEELVEVASEFTVLEEEETNSVIEKVLNNEISKEEFKKELFALVGIKTLADSNHKFNSNTKTKLKVQSHQSEDDKDPYGGLIKK